MDKFDRLARKDFWNDPERWEGIDDPHETMLWEVRRRDVIDCSGPKKVEPDPLRNAQYGQLLNAAAGLQNAMLYSGYSNYLNSQASARLFGGLLPF